MSLPWGQVMATRGGTTASYPIKFESNAKEVGEQGATALDQLRGSIERAQNSVKGYDATLRKLKGSSDEVKAAKLDLKNKIDAERNAITDSTLKLIKAGTSYEKLTEQHKKFSAEVQKNAAEKMKKQSEAMGKAIEGVGGPVADLSGKISGLTDILGGAGGAEGLLALGSVALAAAFLAAGAAAVYLAFELAKFIVVSGDALRSQQLMREAFVGTEEDAKHLGNQVEQLSRKVKLPRDEINKLGSELSLAGLGGQQLVDTLNAASQAGAALGAGAADKIKELGMRGKNTGRTGLGSTELRDANVGFQFKDVREALAKNLKVPLEEAGQALIENRVRTEDFAAALRTVTETKFSKINLAQMLSLDTIKVKAKEAFESLTKNVNLEPLLKAFQDLAGLLDTDNEAGASLRDLIEQFGGGMVDSIKAAEPFIKGFLEGLILTALDIDIAYLELKLQFQDTFGKWELDDNVTALKTGADLATTAVKALGVVILVLAGTTALALTPFIVFAGVVYAVYEALKAVYGIFDSITTKIGDMIVALSSASKAFAELAGGKAGGMIKSGVDSVKGLLPGFAGGLESVPYDDFPARLHKDERVLTAEEAKHFNAIANRGAGAGASGGGGGGGGDISIGPIQISVSGKPTDSDLAELETKVRAILVKVVEDINRQRGFMPAAVGGRTP